MRGRKGNKPAQNGSDSPLPTSAALGVTRAQVKKDDGMGSKETSSSGGSAFQKPRAQSGSHHTHGGMEGARTGGGLPRHASDESSGTSQLTCPFAILQARFVRVDVCVYVCMSS